MRRCVSLFHIWRAELGNLTCYVGHHNVLCLPLWQGVFYLRYKDTAFFAGGQISAIELTRFQHELTQFLRRACSRSEKFEQARLFARLLATFSAGCWSV